MGGNKIELWGRVVGEPEIRTTPAGTSVLRISVETDAGPGDLALAVLMIGDEARLIGAELKAGAQLRVRGVLRGVRRRLKSGIVETGYEVMADSIEMEPAGRE